MANNGNNVYIVDELAMPNNTIEINDDGGTDWITFSNVYAQQVTISLQFSTDPLIAKGQYFPDNTNAAGTVYVTGMIENARGSNGKDDIIGNTGNNIIYGDQARTGAGSNDVIAPDLGNDTVYGGAGNDVVYADDGNDVLYGDAGRDTLNGDAGSDIIQGGTGADELSGGADQGDTVSYSESSAGVTVKLTPGSTTTGSGGDAQGDKINGFTDFIGSAFNDTAVDTEKGFNGTNKNKFDGGAGNDTLRLGGGNDTGIGGTGNDKLYGEVGNDVLDGGRDNDLLNGGAGRDKLTGGAGADTFVFVKLTDSTVAASGRDTITDFSHAQHDKIDLSAIDANANRGKDQDFDFIGTDAFSGHAGELRIKAVSGGYLVQADVDGDKHADFSLIVDTSSALKAGDFIL